MTVLAIFCGGPAHADPLDEFGFGSRAAALAGSVVADARGAPATHYNPAGVALAKYPSILLGYGFGAMQLEINGRDAEVLDARGASLGLAIPLHPHPAVVAAFGIGLYLPDQFLARIQMSPPTEPRFILLDNDPHRIVIEPVLSLAIGDHLAVGAGGTLFSDARGNGITFNVGVVSGEKVGESAIDFGLPLRGAPLVGILIMPTSRVRGGLLYRGQVSLELELDVLANVAVAGVVTGDTLVTARATNYFTPHKLSWGLAVDALEDLTLTGELTWSNWAAYPSGVADIRALVALDVTPPLVQTDVPPAEFANTLSARLGAEYGFAGKLGAYALRAGYAYLPSPVPSQTGLTSFADNDRHLLALGFGVELTDWKPLLTRPIALSVALQWHHLERKLTVKDAAQFPGEAFSSGGDIFHLGSSMSVSF